MITTLRGILQSKSPTEIVMDVHGVGYAVSIPLSTFERLGEPGSESFLFTHLHIREDAHQLFGFSTETERDAFRMLISVTGIGPRMAQSILSGIPVDDLREHLVRGNLPALTAVPGIGRKLAERLVVELREKAGRIAPLSAGSPTPADPAEKLRSEALLALTSLGYSRLSAEKAIRAALLEHGSGSFTVEQLIKAALRLISR